MVLPCGASAEALQALGVTRMGERRGSVLRHSSHFKLLLPQLEIIAIASAAKESYEIWQDSEGKR